MSGEPGQVFQPVVFRQRVFNHMTVSELGSIRRYVRQLAMVAGFGGAPLEELIVAVNEAASNIVRHGFQGRPADISVVVDCRAGAVAVTLIDDGPGFDPANAPKPDTTLPLAERPYGGMGVQLMRDFCDELHYRRDPQGLNELTLLKKMNGSQKSSS